jgi:hypothetical protein
LLLQKSLWASFGESGNLLPCQIEADSVAGFAASSMLILPDERIVATTRCKDVSYLSIVQAGKYYATLAELFL